VVSRVGEMQAALPAAGARLAVVGCGTSFYMAQAFAALREQAGQGETDAFAASEHKLHRGYDAVLVITRSGTTTEVIDVLTGLRGSGVPTTAIVATAGTPVTELADRVILLSEVDEQSVVQTRFATTALALLRASLGEDLTGAVADARAVLAEDEAHGLAGLVDAGQLSFLGRGWTVGLAEEAGLKLRESAQLWTESYPAMEYRHGPISVAGPSSLVWILGSPDPAVADDVAATGATVRIGELDPMAELVLIHRTAVALAEACGLDPDHPRHLTRSVVLQEEGSA